MPATTAAGSHKPAGRPSKTEADIQSDEATNAVIITAGPDVVRRMKSIIRQLDIRRAQVLIECIIAEISNDKSKEFGAQFVLAKYRRVYLLIDWGFLAPDFHAVNDWQFQNQ